MNSPSRACHHASVLNLCGRCHLRTYANHRRRGYVCSFCIFLEMHSNLNGSTLQSGFCYFNAVSHRLILDTTVRPFCIAHVHISELWPDRNVCQAGFVCVWIVWIKPIDLWQGSCLRLLCTRVILMFFSHSLRPKSVSESSCFSPLLYPSACPCTPTAVCQSA